MTSSEPSETPSSTLEFTTLPPTAMLVVGGTPQPTGTEEANTLLPSPILIDGPSQSTTPSHFPTFAPVSTSTLSPNPSASPSGITSLEPSASPSLAPTLAPVVDPTSPPTSAPTVASSLEPTFVPSISPSTQDCHLLPTHSCLSLAGKGAITIGSNSYTAANACEFATVGTIGNWNSQYCTAAGSCSGLEEYEPTDRLPSSPRSMTVGNNSCNRENCCACMTVVPDDSCNVLVFTAR
ncbi:unnamed protein product [Cylindrotheca closterium]|uniref:Uncharacterized protein n=1 Tax=Cylindrotheca closterium TaxID=2856 RepID=A0AAD2CEW9_9STRA|nr:unnamed protein product [Cylindrotheca closterium]